MLLVAAAPASGTFSYHPFFDDRQPLYRGAVHAVRRIPGGTAIYYSVGVPGGATWAPTAAFPVVRLSSDYKVGDASTLTLVDTEGLRTYSPMVGPDGCLCPRVGELTVRRGSGSTGDASGRLFVGWAVMPPLPAEVETVSVEFGYGTQIEDVPVGDGALLPAVPAPSTELGQGWPALPDDAAVAAVPDPSRFIGSLVRRVADLERRVSIDEQPGQVDENLPADVLFAVGSATLTPAAQATVAQVAVRVKERTRGEVTIVGHTDSTGTSALNTELSLARARAVQAALPPGVGPQVTLTATGRGKDEPVADNATDEGRTLNRRVTVTYRVAEPS